MYYNHKEIHKRRKSANKKKNKCTSMSAYLRGEKEFIKIDKQMVKEQIAFYNEMIIRCLYKIEEYEKEIKVLKEE